MSYGYGQQPQGGYQYPYNIPVPVSNYITQQPTQPTHYQQPQPQPYQQPDYWAQQQQQQQHQHHHHQAPPAAQVSQPRPKGPGQLLIPLVCVVQAGFDEGQLSPPPEAAVDPNAFRRFYMHHLQTLTFNSKPVITNLTLFAHQHLHRMSMIVASCLEDHLKNVSFFPDWIRLKFGVSEPVQVGLSWLGLGPNVGTGERVGTDWNTNWTKIGVATLEFSSILRGGIMACRLIGLGRDGFKVGVA